MPEYTPFTRLERIALENVKENERKMLEAEEFIHKLERGEIAPGLGAAFKERMLVMHRKWLEDDKKWHEWLLHEAETAKWRAEIEREMQPMLKLVRAEKKRSAYALSLLNRAVSGVRADCADLERVIDIWIFVLHSQIGNQKFYLARFRRLLYVLVQRAFCKRAARALQWHNYRLELALITRNLRDTLERHPPPPRPIILIPQAKQNAPAFTA